jgi:hypothetical protein
MKLIIFILILVFVRLLYILFIKNCNLDREPFIPLKGDERISVLILNYNRPHNLEKSLSILNKYKVIDQIIVSHGNPDKFKNFEFDKVENRKDYDNTWGAGIRFILDPSIFKHDKILFLDDDIVPSENLVNKLTSKIYNEPEQIFGPIGRSCTGWGYHFFSTNTILTPIMMTSKQVLKNYQSNFKSKYEKTIIKNKGNCEDLSFNDNFRKHYNKTPKLIEGNYSYLDNSNGYSSDFMSHYYKRFNFCRTF